VIVGDVVSRILDGLGNAVHEAWIIWWPLVLGFLLSGVVQAWISRGRIQSVLGGRGLAATGRATLLGAASSSCSYAAIAIAKSAFQKGAGLPAALAFMFASTNLVFEIGIVLWVFLGPAFTAAEFVGGFVLIGLMWAATRLLVSPEEEETVRAFTQGQGDHGPQASDSRRSWRDRLTSVEAWTDVAENFVADWRMLWKEITFGFVVAGFVGLIPRDVFKTIFLTGAPAAVRVIENVVLGPLIAILAFVCSVANIPLGAVLWAGGMSFAGVIAFIYADLVTLPILLIYRKYYGPFTVKLVTIMLVVMMASGLLVELLFSALGLIPHSRPSIASITDAGIRFDYTAVLNILFTVVAAVLVWLTVLRRRRGQTRDRARLERAAT